MGRRNIRQRPLADALGRNQQWLSRRLTGEVTFSIDDLEEICAVLGVDPVTLIAELPPTPPRPVEPVALDRRRQPRRTITWNMPATILPLPRTELAVA